MHDLHLLTEIAIALSLALGGGLLARAIGLSPIVGYLAGGAVIGPFTPGYVADIDAVGELAELGVIFLMFGVGLHFNLRDLMRVKSIAIPGAIIQMTGATLLGAGIGLAFGLSLSEGLVMGLAFSVASTVVLVRSLEERGLLTSMHGNVAIGWLIVEDLAVVLVLVLLPSFSDEGMDDGILEAASALGIAAVFLAVMLIGGARLLPPALGLIARTGSRELFVLAVIAIALGIATGAAAFGLSVALGAFIAGVVISETETSHQAAADVLPFRDAFAVLFFVSVGMLVDPEVVLREADLLIAVVLAVTLGKAIIAFVTTMPTSYPAMTGLTVAAGLAQTGEFTYIIALSALSLDLMSQSTYTVLLTASAVSIVLNPLAFNLIPAAERTLRRSPVLWRLADHSDAGPTAEPPAEAHVVIVGYGRVGQFTGNALQRLSLPMMIVESNIELARSIAASRIPVVWGDAASEEVLRQAGVGHARLLVLTSPDESTALLAIHGARSLNPAISIIARAESGAQAHRFLEMGVREVIVPEYEGGIAVMRETMSVLGFSEEESVAYAYALRDTYYGPESRHAGPAALT